MTSMRPGYFAASSSASAPVPSGDPSSTTSMRAPSCLSTPAARIGRFSRSLYVGVTISTFMVAEAGQKRRGHNQRRVDYGNSEPFLWKKHESGQDRCGGHQPERGGTYPVAAR